MAEGFAAQGVSVFLSDVKGDLSGMMQAGSPEFKLHDAFRSRANKIGFTDYAYAPCSVSLWDVLGQEGPSCAALLRRWGHSLYRGCSACPRPKKGL